MKNISKEVRSIIDAGLSAAASQSKLENRLKICDKAIEEAITRISLEKNGECKLSDALSEIAKMHVHQIVEQEHQEQEYA